MIYGAILAGGTGSRMGREIPKQFMNIGGKPVLTHSLETFTRVSVFTEILVLCPAEWMESAQKYIIAANDGGRIALLEGGRTRNETLMNAIEYIDERHGISDDTVIVTHDAARPFVTERMIEENIAAMKDCDACGTVVAATDTIVQSLDGKAVEEIPDRRFLYCAQTPQTFKAKKLRELYETLTPEEKSALTDATKIFTVKGEAVSLVRGEVYNIKLTYPHDIITAEALIESGILPEGR